MEDEKYLDSGKIIQYDDLRKERYTMTKRQYKDEMSSIKKELFLNRCEHNGTKMCVITVGMVAGTLLFGGYLFEDNLAAGLGLAATGLAVATGLVIKTEDRSREIKALKEEKKTLKKEYKRYNK